MITEWDKGLSSRKFFYRLNRILGDFTFIRNDFFNLLISSSGLI